MTKKVSRFLAISSIILGFLASSCQNKSGSQIPLDSGIPIGEVSSMSGLEATYGMSAHRGIALAIQEANAKGGIRNRLLKLITVDSRGVAEEAAQAVTKLITKDKVVSVVTGVISSNALAMAPIAQTYRVPMMATISTHPKVTEQGNFIFRSCMLDSVQGRVMGKYASQNLKLKTAAILRDAKSDYSVGLSEAFTQEFQAGGGKIIISQVYTAGDMDFKSQLTSIRANHPDLIYVPGYYTDVSLIARQAKDLGMNMPLLGGDGWDSPKLKEIGGAALSGSYFSASYSQDMPSKDLQEFISKYREAYGVIPDGLAVTGYEGAQLLIHAIEKSPSLNPLDIQKALASVKDVPTVTGKMTLDSNRNPSRSAVVLKIHSDGSAKYTAVVDL